MNDPRNRLTHLDAKGKARMVDVSGKKQTSRKAVAEGMIRMDSATLEAITEGEAQKGDVLQVARLAGIQAGKRVSDLIPLCHVLPGASLSVDLRVDPVLPGVRVRAEASIRGQTGVEMEALTAASVSLLTVYDMVKAMDRGMEIGGVRLLSKEGGQSGSWIREE